MKQEVSSPEERRNRARWWLWVQVILALLILIPAAIGFGTKFREFLLLYDSHRLQQSPRASGEESATSRFTTQEVEDGGFALVPIMNYLLVSTGFFLLFIAALMHGMFRDIEKPKRDMLEQEDLLDALDASWPAASSPSLEAR